LSNCDATSLEYFIPFMVLVVHDIDWERAWRCD
jgi:hypothetical protein